MDFKTDNKLKIMSWNINGLSDKIFIYLKILLKKEQPDILCLNETKRKMEVLDGYFRQLLDYSYIININLPSTYHGVSMLIHRRLEFTHLPLDLGVPARYDTKADDPSVGRLITVRIENLFNIIAVYSPNSGVDAANPLKNLDYRLKTWDPALFRLARKLEESLPTVIIGDINVAPFPMDVLYPKRVENHAGFTMGERGNLLRFLRESRWFDSYRYCYPSKQQYTYTGYGSHCPYSMRIDACLMSSDFKQYLVDSFILDEYMGQSDHVPIGVMLDMPPTAGTEREPFVQVHSSEVDQAGKAITLE
jgi:exodeoxyribonuclease-3